ncbi:thiamine-binding protein [Halobellus sp. Atlit-31R]|nr:thiamine-binding protein [Halobellus sp. Atlit-31R]
MTAIARLEVIPIHEGSMSSDIARALETLDEHDVTYETTATDTIIEADSAKAVFAAVQAAHDAVEGDRVITELEVDDQRDRDQHIDDRVAAVETALGHNPRRRREQ